MQDAEYNRVMVTRVQFPPRPQYNINTNTKRLYNKNYDKNQNRLRQTIARR